MAKKYDYDVVIIGAGIAGLVCGCYLAKAGLKTLIVEKNAKAGGYCTSFKRKGFHFDACVHALSSLRSNGLLFKFLRELKLEEKLKYRRNDPTDIIIAPDFKIYISNNVEKTIKEFEKFFPKEKEQIKKFFQYIVSSESFFNIRSKVFSEFLNLFFSDNRLKAVFSYIIYLIVGCPVDRVSALVACLLLKEFIFDGGYYPENGIQSFTNLLVDRFVEFEGEIAFSNHVKKVDISKKMAQGVILGNGTFIKSKCVVSACDVHQTFLKLVDDNESKSYYKNKINNKEISTSGFVVYGGVKKSLKEFRDLRSNIFFINSYDIDKSYIDAQNGESDFFGLHVPSLWGAGLNEDNKESICLATNAHFISKEFWNDEKCKKYSSKLIKLAEKIVPGISDNLESVTTASPLDFYKWTNNYKGAAYGWASNMDNFCDPDFSQKTKIENLYLAGHWSNQSSGVSFVANCGVDTANLILKRLKT